MKEPILRKDFKKLRGTVEEPICRKTSKRLRRTHGVTHS